MGKTVVVLGAGAGGVAAAERLRTNLPAADEVVLLDRSFTASLGLSALRVLRGWRTADEVLAHLRPAALPGVSLVTGEVVGIDTATATVHYRHGDTAATLSYDGLVVALGATLDTAAVPGLAAALSAGVAGEFYTLGGAAELHRRVDAVKSGRVVVLITALPFRCPPAPYEAAFLISDQLGEKFTGGAVRVDVITCEPRPIGIASPEVSAAVVDVLGTHGIGFHAGRTTRRIDPDARLIEFGDGAAEPFDLLAVVPPHRSPAAALLPGVVNPGGWIPVDPATLATGVPGVWAVGDVTALPMATGMPLPKAGIFAESGAAVAADQLTRYLGYAAPDSVFTAEGGCLMVVGRGLAAKVGGRFLTAPIPQVSFHQPSTAFYAEKEQLESEWLARWH